MQKHIHDGTVFRIAQSTYILTMNKSNRFQSNESLLRS